MKSLQQWSDYERDMRLAMILVADGMMNMLGTAPNAKTSAEAFLGIQLPSDFSGFLVNLVADPWGKPDAFLSQITLEGTHLYRTVRRAHDLLTAMKPIHQIGHQDERDEAIDWVGYFLTTVPTDSYGMGADYFDIVETQSNPFLSFTVPETST
ncbi:hypothetical protein NE852_16685 [Rhizobium sp. Pop5]|uniref:hypothetical protein n=1 Tax=Rhizobium sp. Pop5 TaxID=1223565 RepID=UPI002157A05F|nr:hypothetical protein [Rhizobium sp. Pop5]UVD55718.1 hypothetical protein NE852_16685 [Rhizobium sp. Pop5]